MPSSTEISCPLVEPVSRAPRTRSGRPPLRFPGGALGSGESDAEYGGPGRSESRRRRRSRHVGTVAEGERRPPDVRAWGGRRRGRRERPLADVRGPGAARDRRRLDRRNLGRDRGVRRRPGPVPPPGDPAWRQRCPERRHRCRAGGDRRVRRLGRPLAGGETPAADRTARPRPPGPWTRAHGHHQAGGRTPHPRGCLRRDPRGGPADERPDVHVDPARPGGGARPVWGVRRAAGLFSPRPP